MTYIDAAGYDLVLMENGERCDRCGESFRATDERAEVLTDRVSETEYATGIVHVGCMSDGDVLA